MAWRIHLTAQAVNHLYILPGKKPVLAAWSRPNRVEYYDLNTGTLLGDFKVPESPNGGKRTSDVWEDFISTLKGPDDATYLPVVQTKNTTIYTTDDGKLRLYRVYDNELYVQTEGREIKLDPGNAERFVSVDLDRALGMIVALDEQGKIHVYQQDMRLGAFDVGLSPNELTRSSVVVSRGGGSIFASDGHKLVLTDSSGTVRKSLPTYYLVSRLACSPNGGMLATSDAESGVIRIYHGESLVPTHQKFAIDLVAKATQIQLLADLPPLDTVARALTVHAKGVVAFAMSGVVCVTDVSEMDELPRPRKLL
ncbi:hypothetical protein G4Y79_09055 [Phototrophicus methaneseepsis]|uniref:Uncharacterized protein n=1 Tax=Phototrophicus methaneseepsis TaxID=2710758 RepID=A0A7S8ECM7_9CHLR|nr:hypothetical protein [Phototrophicus methaneseepsis]QPC84505.1 hypothetical protein G4Y79_09055 [Phototrophicus methaneseepsis]